MIEVDTPAVVATSTASSATSMVAAALGRGRPREPPAVGVGRASADRHRVPRRHAFHDRATVAFRGRDVDEVAPTVVSRPAADRAVLDSGSKAPHAGSRPDSGFGTILEAPASTVEWLSEEPAVVSLPPEDSPELGQQVRVVLDHVCVVVNLADEVIVDGAGVEPTAWPVDARGRSR